jgi:Ca2+-transporting ATPase
MQALKNLSAPKAIVTRNSVREKIDVAEVVPGDIIELIAGNKVPADVRIFETRELDVDESMLTGESIPVRKSIDPLNMENVAIGDQINMAFMGTTITNGRGRAVAVKTGKNTELGIISEKVSSTEKEQTPLQQRLTVLTWIIGAGSVVLALIAFLIGLLQGRELPTMLLFSISMIVAVIPEGLPVAITITMAIGLRRMAKRNAIVRKLMAVETLGSCNYICSDKTGTITENRMNVTMAYANGKSYEFKGFGYEPYGEIYQDGKKVREDNDLERLLLTGLLCNTASVYEDGEQWKIDGDPTEGALVVAARKFGLGEKTDDGQYRFVDEIPFSSTRKYMASIFKYDNRHILLVKGSPERMLEFSGNSDNDELNNKYASMANQGLRVLGFCVKEVGATLSHNFDLEKESTSGLEFVGFQGIIDPPRKSAVEAIKHCHEAGITVVMITGDHKITASAIARQIGILSDGEMIVTGQEIDSSKNGFLRENLEKIKVYARVSPEHKTQIVNLLQERGNTVAVTGDGVNDAPALKKGHIGVAMGQIGTDVAREASEMVLKDDNFSTIFTAVELGRVIFDNIRKVTFFLIATGAGIAITIIASLFLGLPLPFLATQVLWMNLVTNSFQHIALANEPGEVDIRFRPPRNPSENVITFEVLSKIIIAAIFIASGTVFIFSRNLSGGRTIEYAQSAALNTLVFFQFFHALNSRSITKSIFRIPLFSNPLLFFSLMFAIIAQIAIFHLPFMQLVFHTASLDISTWIETVGISFGIIVAMELDKLIRMRLCRKQCRPDALE